MSSHFTYIATMNGDTLKWINRLVLLVLVSINFALISKPTIQLFEGSTLFVTKLEDIKGLKEPFKWPTLVICRNPIIKNATAFGTFIKASEMNGTIDPKAEQEAYYTNVSDYLYDIAVGSDHLTMFTDTTIRWPLKPPFVSTFLAEYQYKGYCLEISLESIRKEKIERGELNGDDPDNRFVVVLWLKGFENAEENYAFDIIENAETGLVNTGKEGAIIVKANYHTMFQLEFEREERIERCSNDLDESMTNCIMKFLQKKHGNNTFNQYKDLGLAQVNGINFLANYTGCTRPCERTLYMAKEFVSSAMKSIFNPDMKKPFPSKDNETGRPEGTILTINHVMQYSYSKHQQKYTYEGHSYISEVGGISGIFLGISFWSFYEMFIQPFLQKMRKVFSSLFL